jgi:hypothetical protein
MRLGLIGQVRRVLGPRGVKIVQPLQREYKYEYLLLAVLPKEGQLKWSWMPRMKQEHLIPSCIEHLLIDSATRSLRDVI